MARESDARAAGADVGGRRGIELAAADLVKSFDGGLVRALAGVDLEVHPGERVAVTGPTGCGKTTLLTLLGLLDVPDGGELRIDGAPSSAIRSPERWRAENVGIVFQLHHLLPHLTAAENVAVPLAGRGLARREAGAMVGDAIERVGLGHRSGTLAARLSGGERQLVALARALVARPRLLLADEPTGSVDSATGERLVTLILELSAATAATVVLVTHEASVARRMDRVVAMRDGQVVSREALESASRRDP